MRLGIIAQFKNIVLDSLFPLFCVGCNQEGSGICNACVVQVRDVQVDARMLTYATHAHPIVRRAIHEIKFGFIESIARRLGHALGEVVTQEINALRPAVVPVPLHAKRYVVRDFNQAEIVAHAVGEVTQLEVRTDVLFRTRHTKAQAQLSRSARLGNVHEAFVCRGIAPEKVVLVDDVITTGATIQACAQALVGAGTKQIWYVALARG